MSERTDWRICRWVEDELIKSPEFRLPGKKALLEPQQDLVVIDASESPLARPKKGYGAAVA